MRSNRIYKNVTQCPPRCPGNVPHKNRGSGRMRVGAGQLTTFTGGFFMEYASKGLAGTALGFGIGGAALGLANGGRRARGGKTVPPRGM